MRHIRILVSDLFAGDGIGNFILSMEEFLKARNVPVCLYATRRDSALEHIKPDSDLEHDINADDIIVYHHSCGDPLIEKVAVLPQKKVYYYHNMTPSQWFRPYLTHLANMLDLGRTQLPLAAKFAVVTANSDFSLREVREYLHKDTPAFAFPPIIAPLPLACVADEVVHEMQDVPFLLSVGRIVPHKRPLAVLQAFAHTATIFPDLHFCMVGGQASPAIEEEILQLIASMPEATQQRIHRFRGISLQQLRYLYRHALALVSLSQHEGFCLPLLEAMSLELPVIAAPQEAMQETLAGAGIIVPHTNEAIAVADAVSTLRTDAQFRADIIAKGKSRAQQILEEADGRGFAKALCHVGMEISV